MEHHKSEETTHEDGRKDVKVEVKTLDVVANDEITAQAKEYIEKEVIPALAAQKVQVIVVHKHTLMNTASLVQRRYIRNYAAEAIKQFPKIEGKESTVDDFIIIEVDGATNVVISSLNQ
jgi:isocitrate/isopropylmalate dehydrogenase